jgi:hypothetical protein
MSATGYRLLGFAVWRGAKWYLRRRLPSARALAAGAIGTACAGAAVVVIARRAGA